MKISKFYFGPGSPKKCFLRIFRKIFTKKWAGIRNHEWDDGNPGSKSETTETPSHLFLPHHRTTGPPTSCQARCRLAASCWLPSQRGPVDTTARLITWFLLVLPYLTWIYFTVLDLIWSYMILVYKSYRYEMEMISRFPSRISGLFFRKKIRKNPENRFFGLPGPK